MVISCVFIHVRLTHYEMTRKQVNQEVPQTPCHCPVGYDLRKGDPWPSSVMLSQRGWRLLTVWAPRQGWLGLQALPPTAQSPQSPLSLLPALGGSVLRHRHPSVTLHGSLRSSSLGKPLDASRIQIRGHLGHILPAPKLLPSWAGLLTVRG